MVRNKGNASRVESDSQGDLHRLSGLASLTVCLFTDEGMYKEVQGRK